MVHNHFLKSGHFFTILERRPSKRAKRRGYLDDGTGWRENECGAFTPKFLWIKRGILEGTHSVGKRVTKGIVCIERSHQ